MAGHARLAFALRGSRMPTISATDRTEILRTTRLEPATRQSSHSIATMPGVSTPVAQRTADARLAI